MENPLEAEVLNKYYTPVYPVNINMHIKTCLALINSIKNL